MPKYLILQAKRFIKNEFFSEKNSTIVNFPIKNLELGKFEHKEEVKERKYDLIANVVHEGKIEEGTYKVQVRHRANDEWYDI